MLKSGVDLRGLQSQMVLAYIIACKCYGGYECVITSCSDSKHGPNSLHYKGLALDLRTRHLVEPARRQIFDKIKEALGPQFDCVDEGNHFHLEYQPKEAWVNPEDR